ncbi:MAG: hypothetical protein ACRC1M_05695 [Methanobacteriaceae archaeon]
MAYSDDNLNSEELAELYNSGAKNLMFPENPVGNFVYHMYAHTKEDNLLFKMMNSNNIFLCDDSNLSKIGERYGITKPSDYTNLEYRILIAFETYPVIDNNVMENVLRKLFFDSIDNQEDIFISTNFCNFKFSNMDKNNSIMSNQDKINDLMTYESDKFAIFCPDTVDKTALCNVLEYLDLPYIVYGGCNNLPIDIIVLETVDTFYNYVFSVDIIYDTQNFTDNYSIELGSPDLTKLIINNGNLTINTDSYNRVNLINNHQFYVNGEHSGVVYNNG